MVSGEETAMTTAELQFSAEEQHCKEALEDSQSFICLIYMLVPVSQWQSGRLELNKSHVNKW